MENEGKEQEHYNIGNDINLFHVLIMAIFAGFVTDSGIVGLAAFVGLCTFFCF
ncbi:hypothetical protein [Thalassomonas haliotis]|uniref:Uncharacterized protein n=1 Tax=Thalassomonas haliotis TaxID=485448 RepID=A0ABY7VGZ3_9GAMM|nr:hypothetical protein [Thalassomonas haliotis]WDE12841.1 hypothetical protein H3N35_05065 [Thalassomonas haliotis]